ncbi:MAG: glycosyltransferase family 4 protein [Pseudomonadota bacterium]
MEANTSVRPVHLLQIVGGAIVGGMEVYVLRLVQSLPKEQFKIFCICPFESAFTALLRQAGCTVYITRISDEPDWASIQLGLTIIRAARIDVMHAHLPNAHILAGLLGKMTDTPTVATLHSRHLSMRDLEITTLMSTYLSVVSQSAYFHALSLGIREDRVQLISNGVDTGIFRPDRTSHALPALLNLAPEIPLVGFVGRLSHEKGPEVFVRAAIAAHRKLPQCHFVLIGEGPMRAKLEEDIEEAGLGKHIHLAGLQKDMPNMYAALDLVVSTSYSEGMPLALLEAMASGVPVIASQVGGITEVIEVGTTGLLSDPGDHQEVARHIVALITNPVLRSQMGKAARLRIEQNFELSNCVDQTGKLLSSLVHSGNRNDAKISALPRQYM